MRRAEEEGEEKGKGNVLRGEGEGEKGGLEREREGRC